MPEGDSGEGRGWAGALALLGAASALSVVNPGVLVAAPLLLLLLLQPVRRGAGLLVGIAATVLVLGGGAREGIWYLERGWAFLLGGWFLALTLRWPQVRFFPRGLGAVAGAFAILALLFSVRPGDWAVVDWVIRHRMEAGMGSALEALRVLRGPEGLPQALEVSALRAMALQGTVFPALLGLASLAALGFSWWVYLQLARRPRVGVGRLREFRFNDQLVWVLVFGLALLLGSSGVLERVGTNTLVLMGALYALRGVAVVLFLTGGVSLLGALFLVLGFILVAPFLMAGALVIGLGDTWLNLRVPRGEG